jgi:hypothetical protein
VDPDPDPDPDNEEHERQMLSGKLRLRKFIVMNYASGTIHATVVAELAWLLGQCGLDGFTDIAYDPDSEWFTANASRKVLIALNVRKIQDQMLMVTVPISQHNRRIHEELAIANLATVLSQESSRHPDLIMESIARIDCPNWVNHSLRIKAEANGHVAVPWGLFEDATPWKGKGAGQKDSALSWVVNIAGQSQRRTIFSLRKDFFCGVSAECPCRGRCSIDAVDRCICWMGDVAAEGVVPPKQFRNFPWTGEMATLVGQNWATHRGRRVCFILLQLRHDWDQISGGWGFPRPNTRRFCWCCHMEHNTLAAPLGDVILWNHELYMQAVRKCLVIVHVSRDQAELVFDNLIFDRREKSIPPAHPVMHGRVLARNLQIVDVFKGPVTLRRYDRLEFQGDVWDTHGTAAQFLKWPAKLVFWRFSAEVPFKFVSLLIFMAGSFYELLTIDTLHTLDLGVAAKIIGHVLVKIMKSGKMFRNSSSMRGMREACHQLEGMVHAYYSSNRIVSGHRLSKLKLATLEYFKGQCTGMLKSKGAHSGALLGFVQSLLRDPKLAALPHRLELRKAVGSLMQVNELMERSAWKIDSAKLGRLINQCVDSSVAAGIHILPKFHLSRHLGQHAERAGNPRNYTCYADENHNKSIVRLALATSHSDFGRGILAREMLQWQIDMGELK